MAASAPPEKLLTQFCSSAGPPASEEGLALLSKIFRNIVENPSEPKFRRLNSQNAKLQNGLLRFAGASEILTSAGFTLTADSHYELPPSPGQAFVDMNSAIIRLVGQLQQRKQKHEMSAASSLVQIRYEAALNGGARGAGLQELEDIKSRPEGLEALKVVERILINIKRYPDSKRYRSVNVAKAAGQKVLPAMPLLLLAGFEQREDNVELVRFNSDVLERVYAMVWWAARPEPPPALRIPSSRAAHALGAVLGAAIGDALAAPLSGKEEYAVTAEEVDRVMEMCGGGLFTVAPGQVTDCTEMAVCLADSLATCRTLVTDDLSVKYGKWGQSLPFHMESGCSQVFRRPLTEDAMMELAKDKNGKSAGSGALVRCPPLAAFAAGKGADVASVAQWARQDARLSHPDGAMGEASAAFAIMMAQLIATCGDRASALAQVREWAEREKGSREASRSAKATLGPTGWTHLPKPAEAPALTAGGGGTGRDDKSKDEWVAPGAGLVAFEEIVRWMLKAFGTQEIPFKLERMDSSAEVAFTHALRHLHRGSSFETAMRATIAGGMDSCANASVVGGLLGAAVGVQGIPTRWVQAVLACDTAEGGQPRPPDYHPSRLPDLIEKICG